MELNLEPHYYVDPGIFRQERAGLMTRSWQLLGPARKVSGPGQYLSEDVAGIKVLVVRGSDGVLRAFRNVCRHRGAQLVGRGGGHLKTIRCPYHCWTYSDTGQLRHVPWFGEDPDFDLADWPLEYISVAIWRGLLFVAVDPVEPLEDQLGAARDAFDDVEIGSFGHADTVRVEFDANWKIYTDNFVEGYHIPGIHPAFHAAVDFERFRTTAADNLVTMTAPPRDGLFYLGRWYWMWPNWTLSLFRGGMNTSRINPLGPDRTELIYDFYFEDMSEGAAEFRERTIAGNLDVVREDFGICLETHQNYASGGYRPGPLSPRHEKGVHWFQSRYLECLGH